MKDNSTVIKCTDCGKIAKVHDGCVSAAIHPGEMYCDECNYYVTDYGVTSYNELDYRQYTGGIEI